MREMDRSEERLHERLNRTVRALNDANVDYAVIGGNAVGSWLTQAREGAGIQTRDVDILLRRDDITKAEEALKKEGFVRRNVGKFTIFLDSPSSQARNAVHVVFAGEKYDKDYLIASPDVDEYESMGGARILSLSALTRMKLTSFRSKDRGHLIELIKEGLVDSSMSDKLPDNLKSRFRDVWNEFESTRQEWE